MRQHTSVRLILPFILLCTVILSHGFRITDGNSYTDNLRSLQSNSTPTSTPTSFPTIGNSTPAPTTIIEGNPVSPVAPTPGKEPLSLGATAGIALGCLMFVFLILYLANNNAVYACFTRAKSGSPKYHEDESKEMGYVEMKDMGDTTLYTEELNSTHGNASGALWYDVNWARDVKTNLSWLMLQDTLALIKSLVASITLFYLTRPGDLLVCDAVKYRLIENLVAEGSESCINSNGARESNAFKTLFAQPLVSDVPLGDVFNMCKPSLELAKNDAAFAAMIIVNQVEQTQDW